MRKASLWSSFLVVLAGLSGCTGSIDGPSRLGDDDVAARFDAGPSGGDADGAPDDSIDAAPLPDAVVNNSGGDPVLVGAGDIGSCDSTGDEATAALLDDIDGTIFTAGDNGYDDGSPAEFMHCFHPSWGRHKARIRPAPGNHEYYADPPGSGYFGYFGAAAGPPGKGWYSYDLGAWHIIVLNTNRECEEISCAANSAQGKWLREDLEAHANLCTLAIYHHPRFSSGDHGDNDFVQDFWAELYAHHADVVVNGHDHSYERFAPQDAHGDADPTGLREFVVGTGGVGHYDLNMAEPNSEVRQNTDHGVLKLTLHEASYDWEFIPAGGGSFHDSGTGACH
jgi:hypothetical protein